MDCVLVSQSADARACNVTLAVVVDVREAEVACLGGLHARPTELRKVECIAQQQHCAAQASTIVRVTCCVKCEVSKNLEAMRTAASLQMLPWLRCSDHAWSAEATLEQTCQAVNTRNGSALR